MHFVHQAQRVNGAHIKIWHYHEHIRASGRFDTSVWLAPGSTVTADSPWAAPDVHWLADWDPADADVLFLNANNWRYVPDDCAVPVMNLLQSTRHADPADERYRFLGRRAFRVSISEEITEALAANAVVNGPVVTIPLGTDIAPDPSCAPWTRAERPVDVVIAGLKNPTLALALADVLRADGHEVQCVTTYLPRKEFLALFRRARVAVTLPTTAEGFFLPPLEALAQGCIPVCPEAAGLRHYREQSGVLSPPYEVEEIAADTRRALALDGAGATAMLDAGASLAQDHRLETERRRLVETLDDFVTFSRER